MSTYYDYLKDRVLAASPRDQAQLEHLVHLERNAMWQQIVANPAYDEHSRMAALAAFDEAASYVLSEQSARFGRGPARPSLEPGPPAHHVAADEPPPRSRSIARDVILFLIGAAVGFAIAYFAGNLPLRIFSGAGAGSEMSVRSFAASQRSFKFAKSEPSPLEGEITVDYASGAPSEDYACEVDATYKEVLEYAKFDEACTTVSFKFRPLSELWANFNYLQGYIVFSATIMSPQGGKWQGSTSVFFSVDATA